MKIKEDMRAWLREFNEEILPLRHDADNGDASYDEYDNTYNEHLEDLHRQCEHIVHRLPEPCIYPGCENSRRTRGLCHGHYQTMRSYVRKGLVTEEQLERRGLLLEKGTGGGEVTVGHALFLKDTEEG